MLKRLKNIFIYLLFVEIWMVLTSNIVRPLHTGMLWVKFGWKWPLVLKKKIFINKCFQSMFAVLLLFPPWKRAWPFNRLKFVHPRMQMLNLMWWANIRPMTARLHWRVANNSNHYTTLAQRFIVIWDCKSCKKYIVTLTAYCNDCNVLTNMDTQRKNLKSSS